MYGIDLHVNTYAYMYINKGNQEHGKATCMYVKESKEFCHGAVGDTSTRRRESGASGILGA